MVYGSAALLSALFQKSSERSSGKVGNILDRLSDRNDLRVGPGNSLIYLRLDMLIILAMRYDIERIVSVRISCRTVLISMVKIRAYKSRTEDTQVDISTCLTFPSELILLYCKAAGDSSAFPREGALSDKITMIAPGSHVIAQRNHVIIVGSSDLLSKAGAIAGLLIRSATCA